MDGKDWKNPLHDEVLAALQARSRWETKQTQFYRMRHNGIARSRKEPWQSDLHWPLIDTNIEKLKPLFLQQLFGMDVVASFVPMRPQLAAFTTTAEQWFDYKVREKSNIQDEALSWIDYTLMGGRGVIKCYWDLAKRQLAYDAIDPLYFIVPSYTKELQDADWMVHVMPMSKDAYKRKAAALGWKSDKATIEKLLGSEDTESDAGQKELKAARNLREGITHDSKHEKVIVWECYQKTQDGKWLVKTYSPAEPDIELRPTMELVYDHGQAPFVDFPYEVKDKGWYSPRGIAELLAPFESALNHTWNQKHDSMTLFNRPLFRAEREVPNSINLRMQPGQILPYGIAPVPMPQPPMSFDQEITQVRQIAEQRVSNPDYGMGQVINTSNRRTATEIEAINSQTAQSGDLRARIFRVALSKLYRQSWALLIQFDKDSLRYRFLEDAMDADPVALHLDYTIEPKGGFTEVNRAFLFQKAMARLQVLGQSPNWDRSVLEKDLANLDDPTLVKRAFVDPQNKQQDEVADETRNIPALLIGAQFPVRPGQDYTARIQVLLQYLQSVQAIGNPLPPQGQQAIVGRIDGLLQAYEQVDNNGAKQLRKQIQGDLQAAGMLPQAAPVQAPVQAAPQAQAPVL